MFWCCQFWVAGGAIPEMRYQQLLFFPENISCSSPVKDKQSVTAGHYFSCGVTVPDSLSPNTLTLSPQERQCTCTHSFNMCHRANYQESGCWRIEWFKFPFLSHHKGLELEAREHGGVLVRQATTCIATAQRENTTRLPVVIPWPIWLWKKRLRWQ